MIKYVVVTGLDYAGETREQAEAREKAMLEHNRRVDEQQAEWDRQRRSPMPSMRAWLQSRVGRDIALGCVMPSALAQ